MRILFFGTNDDFRDPRVRILREGLAAHGNEVLECVRPLGFTTEMRVRMLQRPWLIPLLAVRLAWAWLRLAVASMRFHDVDAVVVGYMGHLDVRLAALLFPRAPIVLDHLVSLSDTAVDRRAGTPWLLRVLDYFDRAAVRTADVVLVDTQEHVRLLPEGVAHKAIVVTVGAPEAKFRVADAERPSIPQLRVLFFGLHTPLQGTPVIGAAIGALADRSDIAFTMLGRGQDLEEAQRLAAGNPNVTWVTEVVPPSEVEREAESHHVVLGIFDTGPKARRVVPTKVFEGAAMGCAVVTSDTEPQRRLFGEAAVLVPPGDGGALATALAHLAEEPHEVERRRKAAAELARARYSPAACTGELHARLQRLTRLGRPARGDHDLPALTIAAALRWDLLRPFFSALDPATRVLEVGPGMGSLGLRLARRVDYTGVEPDPRYWEIAAGRFQEFHVPGEVLHGDVSAVPDGDVFDVVCAFEVLEHIRDDVGALSAWRRRTRDGGRLVISVPADAERFGPADELVGHWRRYDRDGLISLLREAGFADVSVRHYGHGVGSILEKARNVLAALRLRDETATTKVGEGSRWLQPSPWMRGPMRLLVAVSVPLQRRGSHRDRGPGLIATARAVDRDPGG